MTDNLETAVEFISLALVPWILLHSNTKEAKGFPPGSLHISIACKPSSNWKFGGIDDIDGIEVGGSIKKNFFFK